MFAPEKISREKIGCGNANRGEAVTRNSTELQSGESDWNRFGGAVRSIALAMNSVEQHISEKSLQSTVVMRLEAYWQRHGAEETEKKSAGTEMNRSEQEK